MLLCHLQCKHFHALKLIWNFKHEQSKLPREWLEDSPNINFSTTKLRHFLHFWNSEKLNPEVLVLLLAHLQCSLNVQTSLLAICGSV